MKKQLLAVLLATTFTLPSFAHDPSNMGADHRQIIWVSDAHKNALLSEMRVFLQASQQILAATLENDMTTVESVAREVGVKLMKGTPEEIMKQLPKGFTDIAPLAHLGFEDIADEASGLGDSQVILKRLAALQVNCVSCHTQFQFKSR